MSVVTTIRPGAGEVQVTSKVMRAVSPGATVSDAGFKALSALTSLAELKLDRTDISDASLGWLTKQKSLKYADLYHSQFAGRSTGPLLASA